MKPPKQKIIIGIRVIFLCSFLLINTVFASGADFENITVQEAWNRISLDSNIFILDVRTEGEFLEGHIQNAVLIRYNKIIANTDKLPDEFSRGIIVYCDNGYRSISGATTLVQLGYTNVSNMLGGLVEWMNEGYPIIVGNTTTITSKVGMNYHILLVVIIGGVTTFTIVQRVRRGKAKTKY